MTFGEKMRELMEQRGITLGQLARDIPCNKGHLSNIWNDKRPPSERLAEILDNALNANGELVALCHDPTKRRTALQLGLTVALTPELLDRVLNDAALEAMEFTRDASSSGVGRGTFDHLENVLAHLDRNYSRESPASLFNLARTYRRRVAELIEGPSTLKEARDLYVYAAWLSEMLAWISHDLGSAHTAEAYAIDCYEHADQAGYGELCGWAMDAMASISMYMDRPDRAQAAALRGIAKVPQTHPLAVRLRGQAARAYARLGNADECTAMLRGAGQMYNQLPAKAPRRFAVDTGTLADYAMTAYSAASHLSLGNYAEAKKHAEAAVAIHEAAPPHSSSPSREAIARIDLGIALAHLGSPDGASEYGQQALASPRVVDSVRTRAGELQAVLTANYPQLTDTQDFREQYRQLLQGEITSGEAT